MQRIEGKIIIIGANGFVAKNLRKYFHHNDIPIVSIARKDFPAFKQEKKIIVDNYLPKTLPMIKNAKCLIHLVGIGNQNVDSTFDSVNVILTRNIVNYCKRLEIPKIIFNSGLGVSKSSTTAYFVSKFNAEKIIISSGLDYTIFRPSYIIGNNDLLSRNLKKQKNIIIPGSGKYRLQPIVIDDVVKILHQATHSKKYSNKTIDLVGPKIITFEKFVRLRASGQTIKKIPLEKAYHDAICKKSIYDVEDLNIMIGDFVGNHKRLANISQLSFSSPASFLRA